MIVSASYRTDIPAFYGDWFMNRLEAGACRVKNPYNGKVHSVSLRAGDVDGLVFWTKNIGPFLDNLTEIRRRGLPFVVQYTVNAYPSALERSVPHRDRSVKLLKFLSNSFGPRSVVWRYDPIIESSLTPYDWHLANFAELAAALRGATDEVVISFAQIYRKTRRNLTAAAQAGGFAWTDPDEAEKRALARKLAEIAADSGMRLTLCTQPALAGDGIEPAACIDAARLSEVASKKIVTRIKANRPGCLCAESRDIGAYDTCPMGCAYCYAVGDRDAAVRNHAGHEAKADGLSRRAAN